MGVVVRTALQESVHSLMFVLRQSQIVTQVGHGDPLLSPLVWRLQV